MTAILWMAVTGFILGFGGGFVYGLVQNSRENKLPPVHPETHRILDRHL